MCGIICIFNKINIDLLQHIKNRGQESYGFSYFNKNKIVLKNFIGKMPKEIEFNSEEFNRHTNENPIKYIIGHTRYSTSGKKLVYDQTQPIMGITRIKNKVEPFMLVHNGNIYNRQKLKELFGCNIDERYSDTQILVDIINKQEKDSWRELFLEIMEKIPGVYNFIIGTRDKIFIIRDRYGVRPLCVTKEIGSEKNYCVLSESSKIPNNNYEIVRDIEPGEMAVIDKTGFYRDFVYSELKQTKKITKFTPCLFEYIYFCAKETVCDDVNITTFRYNSGRQLAINDNEFISDLIKTENKDNIVVVGAPETGITSGMGYADLLNLNYHQVLYKKNYGRTFILDEKNRKKEFTKKYGILEKIVKNKIVIIVDDSLVRGNTLKVLISQLRELNIEQIHIRIAAPPVISPCYFGIDIPTYKELIAHNCNNIDDINKEIKSNSLKYLKISELIELLPPKNKNACVSCFTNDYNNELLDW
jgi:amidophosphoribosyltransferase